MTSVGVLVQSPYDRDPRVRRKAEALAAAGYSVDVYALRGTRSERRYTLNGVNVLTLGLGKKRGSLARYLLEYAAFFLWAFGHLSLGASARRYAVIEANTLPDFLVFAGIIAKWRGTRLVLDMHEITPEFYISKYRLARRSWLVRLLERVERASMRFADRVITINHPIEDLLVTRGLPRAKCTVIMNSADERVTRPAPTRPVPAPPAGAFVAMYHGTLTEIYGLDLAIVALARARRDLPGAELWILGDGPQTSALQRLARERGVAAAVRFVGVVPPTDVPAWLQASDMGVLPMRRDVFLDFAFPNKLSEFVIAGKAVAVSRLRAIGHYFSDGAVAYFEPGDPDDLARQMVRLGRQPDARAALAAQARREYEPIRWDVMRDRYLALMAGLVAERARARRPAAPAAASTASPRRARMVERPQ